jgi:hypothetical protein
MATQIDQLYTILINIATDLGYFSKADTNYFETHPAIGFGTFTVENSPELGENDRVNIDIPVVLVDAGLDPLVNVKLAKMYEEWRDAFFTNISTELATAGITCNIIEFGDYNPKPSNNEDIAETGLEGTVGFQLKL